MTAGSSATSARASASCARASAACASCAPGTDDASSLTTYGRSWGFCIDPIEKKPLNHFLPGTPVLSFGTAGCNLACKFCQNWDISQVARDGQLADARAARADRARAARQLGCRSVAFTYNDPVIFLEYAIDVAHACREPGASEDGRGHGRLHHASEPRAEFYRHMDAANVDLKAFTERLLQASLRTAACSRCSTPCATSSTRPTSGSRSPPC